MSIKIGVIGCGKIAQRRHLPEYAANKDAVIYGVYDINEERTKEVAELYGAKAYASRDELLADPEIDAVSICLPNYIHARDTIAALKAGKHVLCEKPMGTSMEECEAMVAAAKEAGKHLMIGQNQRLAKAHVKAKELIAEGAIGKVLRFRTTFGHGGPDNWSIDPGPSTWFFKKELAAMGAMADLGVHKIDMIQHIIGQKIVEAQAILTTVDKKGEGGNLISVDDNAICLYTMENGTIGVMEASWTCYGAEDNSTTIYGSKGALKLYADPDYSVQLINADGTKVLYQLDAIQTNDKQTSSGVIDEFIGALTEGREPAIPATDVLHSMKVVFACIESSEKGHKIVIE